MKIVKTAYFTFMYFMLNHFVVFQNWLHILIENLCETTDAKFEIYIFLIKKVINYQKCPFIHASTSVIAWVDDFTVQNCACLIMSNSKVYVIFKRSSLFKDTFGLQSDKWLFLELLDKLCPSVLNESSFPCFSFLVSWGSFSFQITNFLLDLVRRWMWWTSCKSCMTSLGD